MIWLLPCLAHSTIVCHDIIVNMSNTVTHWLLSWSECPTMSAHWLSMLCPAVSYVNSSIHLNFLNLADCKMPHTFDILRCPFDCKFEMAPSSNTLICRALRLHLAYLSTLSLKTSAIPITLDFVCWFISNKSFLSLYHQTFLLHTLDFPATLPQSSRVYILLSPEIRLVFVACSLNHFLTSCSVTKLHNSSMPIFESLLDICCRRHHHIRWLEPRGRGTSWARHHGAGPGHTVEAEPCTGHHPSTRSQWPFTTVYHRQLWRASLWNCSRGDQGAGRSGYRPRYGD